MDNDWKLAGLTALAVSLTSGASAQEARHCVNLEQVNDNGRQLMALINTCPEKVYVRWCYEGNDEKACNGSKFYNRSWVLRNNEPHTSPRSLPTGPAIHYAACYSKFPYVFKDGENAGAYTCKPVVQCAGDARPVVFSRLPVAENTKVAVYEAKRKGVTHTFKLEKAAFENIPQPMLEKAAKLRICVDGDDIGSVEKIRKDVMKYLKDEMRHLMDKCTNAKEPPEECAKLKNEKPHKSGGSGRKG